MSGSTIGSTPHSLRSAHDVECSHVSLTYTLSFAIMSRCQSSSGFQSDGTDVVGREDLGGRWRCFLKRRNGVAFPFQPCTKRRKYSSLRAVRLRRSICMHSSMLRSRSSGTRVSRVRSGSARLALRVRGWLYQTRSVHSDPPNIECLRRV